jgi:hypothetical protein
MFSPEQICFYSIFIEYFIYINKIYSCCLFLCLVLEMIIFSLFFIKKKITKLIFLIKKTKTGSNRLVWFGFL